MADSLALKAVAVSTGEPSLGLGIGSEDGGPRNHRGGALKGRAGAQGKLDVDAVYRPPLAGRPAPARAPKERKVAVLTELLKECGPTEAKSRSASYSENFGWASGR